MIKKNIIANYLGQGWTALMGLAFVPLYIRYLGMESYGLIGIFAVMQAWLSLLDMGMSPTLNREMARFTSGAHSAQSIHNLLRSLEMICFSFAALIALGVFSASGYLASDWLKADKLPSTVVAQALSVMAFVVALRFVEGIYRGSLFGLQRQVWYNSANAILATVRHVGAVAVLAWVLPTVQTFFLWQAAISLLSIAVFARGVHQVLPKPPLPPKFSYAALTDVWRFARGMLGITFLAILLTQVDKVLLSRMLPLESFGYYTLAATVAGVLSTVIGPITDAIYPRMVELATEDDPTTLVSLYHQGAQLVTILSASAVMLLIFFAGGVMFMWSGNVNLAENTAPILSVLAVGSFLNALMWIPYRCQLAHGWTSLSLKVNFVAVIVLIPAIIWVVPRYGALGAAWIWVALNAGYFLVAIQLMHRRLIPKEKWHWYFADVFLPVVGAIGSTLLAQQLQPASYQNRWLWFAFLLVTGVFSLVAAALLANRIRPRLLTIMGTTFCWRYF
ncbi:oligosaccharide flippase family protein [Methylovulum psychrotolerans]|jgi:O-antigen/teichoic acid export membrane protein|uniref:oligosaccharide flippase family protein n=1 Tax=Methylovulum psychrotolerans TaxID=1704499 RepID=UPI001BFFA33A|nr:oligosaccharide flippase family protein [Methylovulum psychrotolerans]MBT9099541.1 oligosaccharide flippase family protein [Methylovulum psychrotolerans]